MGRQARPWYLASRDSWCIYVNGKQVTLCKGKANRKEAYRRFLTLSPDETKAVTSRVTGQEVCSLFCSEYALVTLKPKTYRWYKMHLDRFGSTVASIDGSAVTPKEVTKFINAHPQWNVTTRCGAISAIKRAW
jgi:hypothetical protein